MASPEGFSTITELSKEIKKTPSEIGRELFNLGYRKRAGKIYIPTDEAYNSGLALKIATKAYDIYYWNTDRTIDLLTNNKVVENYNYNKISNDYVIHAKDIWNPKGETELIPTKNYPYAKFPYEYFNPAQSSIYPYFDKDVNLVITTKTSSGKTIAAEMVIAHTVRKSKRSAVYVAPMKALAMEKYNDWTKKDHHFSNLNIQQCSGDFMITKNRVETLSKADIVSITPEMLASCCRNTKSDKAKFLSNVRTIVVDEFHITTCPGRGDSVELSLMQMAELHPDMKIIALSATMNNAEEIAKWFSSLNSKKTVILQSAYRPVILKENFVEHEKDRKYRQNELNKILKAVEVVKQKPNEKFLLFVHTKKTGNILVNTLKSNGIEAEFHNADRTLEDRIRIEEGFKDQENGLRVIVATSTLAWGMNLPAKNIIIVGFHRAFEEVAIYDLIQEVGRAGRPQYDKEGFVYYITQKGDTNYWRKRLSAGNTVDSTLAVQRIQPGEDVSQYAKRVADTSEVDNNIAFHIIAEIYNGVNTKEEIERWYERTLAYFQQGDTTKRRLDLVLSSLLKAGLIYITDHETYGVTILGKIASQFYYPPFDVSGFYRNLQYVQDRKTLEALNDYDLAYIFSNINNHAKIYFNLEEKANIDEDFDKESQNYKLITDVIQKAFYAYYLILKGDIDGIFAPFQAVLMQDVERMILVIKAIDSYYKFGLGKKLDIIERRLKYALPDEERAMLCMINGIGRVRAIKLYNSGIETLNEFIDSPNEIISSVIGIKNIDILDEMKRSALDAYNTYFVTPF